MSDLRLDYFVGQGERPRRWWLLGVVGAVVAGGNALMPSKTPPGWPMNGECYLMALVPAGALLLAAVTSIPAWVIGLYGALAVVTFVPGMLEDSNLIYRLDSAATVHRIVAEWCVAMLASWVVCRGCVVVRSGRRWIGRWWREGTVAG